MSITINCIVLGCTSSSSKGDTNDYSFHEFPKDINLKVQWITNIGRPPTDFSRICSRHFEPSCFRLEQDKKVLLDNAVPSLFPKLSKKSAKLESKVRRLNVSEENALGICRICLATDCKMYPLTEQKMMWYQTLIGAKLRKHKGLPKWLCTECNETLTNVNKFKNKSIKAQELMIKVLKRHGVINVNTIKTINRTINDLESCIQIKKPKTKDIKKIKREIPIKELFKNEVTTGNDMKVTVTDGSVKSELLDVEFVLEKENNDDGMMGDDDGNDDDGNNDDDSYRPPIKRTKTKQKRKTATDSVSKSKVKSKRQQSDEDELDNFTITKLSVEEQEKEWKKRKESMHYKRSNYKCEICYAGLYSLIQYNMHMDRHTNKVGYKHECTICKLYFKSEGKLKFHSSNHIYKYTCKHCNNFTTAFRHVAMVHNTYHKGRQYPCQHCSEVFMHQLTLRFHMRKKHPSANMKEFICELCGHCFSSRNSMNKHRQNYHPNPVKVPDDGPFCDTCDVRFVNDDAFNTHIKRSFKHERDERLWKQREQANDRVKLDRFMKCTVCDREFNNYHSFGKHMKVLHPVEYEEVKKRNRKIYLQNRDGSNTVWKTKVIGNKTVKRQQINRDVYCDKMCELCGKMFMTHEALKNHSWVHTGVKMYECNDCGKKISSKEILRQHMKTHSFDTQSFCELCGKTFAYLPNLQRHKRLVHSDLRAFKCDICEKSFKTKAELETHKNHVHLNIPWPTRKRKRGERSDV